MKEAVLERRSQFEQVRIGTPLLTTSEDTDEVLQAVMAEIRTIEKEEAVVFMGHGTPHDSNSVYTELEQWKQNHLWTLCLRRFRRCM